MSTISHNKRVGMITKNRAASISAGSCVVETIRNLIACFGHPMNELRMSDSAQRKSVFTPSADARALLCRRVLLGPRVEMK
ncbi:hypothetical protein NPIL_535971 [Nephila pilipes]|uniref:Uncharacterized protein n=1 Tax=Nephila pilipes TaxID=299642 RepID=A0A8X6NIV6_NEPPI|nr:hypothetical protein NPIL_535971 [Nephila pilipes]